MLLLLPLLCAVRLSHRVGVFVSNTSYYHSANYTGELWVNKSHKRKDAHGEERRAGEGEEATTNNVKQTNKHTNNQKKKKDLESGRRKPKRDSPIQSHLNL